MSQQISRPDVLIVGSGPIGAAYARFLVAAGRKVTMIDIGTQLSPRPGEHLLNAFRFQQQPNLFNDIINANLEPYSIPEGSDYLSLLDATAYNPPVKRKNFENPDQDARLSMPHAGATYAVGGMFTHWTGSAPDPAPMERTPLIPAGDWDQTLPIARRLFNVHTDAFEPSFLNGLVKKRLNDLGYPVDNLPMGAERRGVESDIVHFVTWTGVDTVLGPLAYTPERYQGRFEILPQHRAEKLVLRGSKIEHVVVRDLTNYTTQNVSADTFVVAGGPFLTPRLLWQSGIRPEALGRFLNENPIVSCRVVLNNEIVAALRDIPNNPARKEPIPIPWNDPEPMSGFSPSPDRPWHTQIHRAGRYTAYDSVPDVRLVLDFVWFGMVDPVSDNRITFSSENLDRFGMPQITIEYRLGSDDAKRAHAMLQDMITAALAVGGFLPGAEPQFNVAGASLHFQGVYRMGDDAKQDDKTSVVSTYSQVWGVDNLYLGGIGVIPNKMANNPTLTACAMAVRSVSKILGCSIRDLNKEVGLA